jgi:hypothetical protein
VEVEDAIRRVRKLAEYRDQYIAEHGKPPPFQEAIGKLGVSTDEVHRHAIDLYVQWYEVDFHLE